MRNRIIARIRRSVSSEELQGEALNGRIAELRKATKDWLPAGGMESPRLYEFMQAYHILPYPGGLLQQPKWVRDDFDGIALLYELASLLNRLPKAKPGMRTMAGLVETDGR